MALKLIVAPVSEPVTLAEAKAHLRTTHDLDDSMIAIYLQAARERLDGQDGITGRALMPQTWELQLDQFPCGAIRVPLPPLQSVTSIKYYDANAVEQTLDPLEYVVDTSSRHGWIAPATSWPSTFSTLNAVKVRFVCGYADAASVPAGLKAAILLMMADMFENRESGIVGVNRTDNPTVDMLVFPYRMLDL